jgi:hypothetical protein
MQHHVSVCLVGDPLSQQHCDEVRVAELLPRGLHWLSPPTGLRLHTETCRI